MNVRNFAPAQCCYYCLHLPRVSANVHANSSVATNIHANLVSQLMFSPAPCYYARNLVHILLLDGSTRFIETDYAHGYIYWSNAARTRGATVGIHRIKPDGSGLAGVVTDGIGRNGVAGFAIDWLAGT